MTDPLDMATASNPGSVYRSIRAQLMSGDFKPGEKLRPAQLAQTHKISASALREILLRLSHEKLLHQEEQRGFNVPETSQRHLLELMELRILLECEGARQSIINGDVEWEARLNAVHHKLVHIEQKMKLADAIEPYLQIWTRVDWEFHETLLSACPSGALRDTYRNIYEQFRQQVVAGLSSAGFRSETIGEHAAILQAALNRDVAACHVAITRHVQIVREKSAEHATMNKNDRNPQSPAMAAQRSAV